MRGKPGWAIVSFERAARLMPQWSIVRKRLAALYERHMRWAGAAREYEGTAQLARKSGDTKTAAALEQQAANAFFRQGVMQFYRADNEGAAFSLGKSVHYRQTFAPAQHYLALAFAELGRWDDAERAIAAAARLTPTDDRVVTNVQRIRNREMRVLPKDYAPTLEPLQLPAD
jgi:Flp pilus assembly protein TadD